MEKRIAEDVGMDARRGLNLPLLSSRLHLLLNETLRRTARRLLTRCSSWRRLSNDMSNELNLVV